MSVGSISLSLRLRPIRFAFVVRPEDKKRVTEIFRINTCLWGGMYNPIIPFFKRLPQWWERREYHFENAKQIINGYLDYFEPDFIVEAEKGIAEGLGFDSERVLQLSDILVRSGDREREGCGLGVLDLYRELYNREFKFVRRHKHNIIHIEPDNPKFKQFNACVFGEFPGQQGLKYLEKAYIDAFDPQIIKLKAASFVGLYKSGYFSALNVGSAKINIQYHGLRDPIIFILDANESKDLVDFWNLRAVEQNVLAIPVQWIETLSSFCKELITKNYRPLPGNPHGVMIDTTLMFSRSIAEKDIEGIYKKHFDVGRPGTAVLQVWYPPIWRPASEHISSTTRPTLNASEKSITLPLDPDKPDIQFESLYPDFMEEYGNDYRWANVVRLQTWGDCGRVATTFPCNYRNPLFPKFRMGGEHLLPTSEGLTFFPRYKNISEHWRLTDCATAFTEWFKVNQITSSRSESGRSTQQIIETLDGFWGVRSIAHDGIIKLLNEMSRRPIKRSMHFMEFKNKINAAIKKDIWRGRTFETLVERKAVELGLELQCSKCNSWSWHPINQLDHIVTCDLCLKKFNFPITAPSDSKWSYRVIGPFALPDWAKGGYAAALAIRFFAEVTGLSMDADVTWSSGLKLTLPNGASEADFILWYQRKKRIIDLDRPTQIVFGEAKSFGNEAFEKKDIERMKLLAEAFPSSILVFATMKDAAQLSKGEVNRIRKLAEWGREYDRARHQTIVPVIMLTSTELFAPLYIQQAWKDKGGRHKELISQGWVRTNNLRVLADLTQQLYLGMPSYHSWIDAKWKKRAARKHGAAKQSSADDK